ncbi:MAG: lamin tail domain-containing protein [Prolixibacteraceae bacterium]|nr:lamin tail domain-containing protein [Prolixibacteraceae bacterium]
MALNQTVLADEDGEYSDWIELYNPTGIAVDLQGWSLTDDYDLSSKWFFSDITINPGEFIVLFASGKDRNTAGSEMHTNFKLSGSGEYLALFNSAGIAVSEFSPAFPAQIDDYSYGFFEDIYIEFSDPTPGEDNSQSGGTVLPPPEFNVRHGFFNSPFSLTITSGIETAKIYYTTDGSFPNQINGSLYSHQLYINTTSVIRAIAILEGAEPSEITTQTYIFPNDVLRQTNTPDGYPVSWGPYAAISGTAIADYEMDHELMGDAGFANTVKEALQDIPTISLVTDKENIFSHSLDPDVGGIYIYPGAPGDETGRGWERPVSFEYFDNDSISVQANCGIRIQGGHSRRPEKSPKHSFLLAFRSEYGPSKLNYSMFEEEAAPKYDKLILRAGFGNSWIHHAHDERQRAQYQRDIWTKDTQRDMGHPSGNSSYVHLYINGIYWGLYAPSERMDSEFAAKYMGGNEDNYDVIKDYAEVADGTIDAWEEMMKMVNAGLESNEAYQAIQGNDPAGMPNPETEAMVDVVNLTDYMIINFYGSNTDWDHHNWAAARNRVNPDKGFKFFCWDAEHMVKTLNGNVLNENNEDCPSSIFQQLMKNKTFRRLFADRVQKHCFNNGALTPEETLARWLKRKAQIETAVYAESARWGDYRRDVHRFQSVGPFDLYTVEKHYLPQQEFMQNEYFPNRTDIFIRQLRSADMFPDVDAPIFYLNNNQYFTDIISRGDILSMTTTEGTIYYTTNGTDPVNWPEPVGGNETVLLSEDADKSVLVPTSNIGTTWYTANDYYDSNWQLCSGSPGGVGYERSSGYASLISLNVSSEMYNGNTTCYIRIPFQVSEDDLSAITNLILKVRYDDGFVAYLNGQEVARMNAPGSVAWNSAASGSHEADNNESFNITQFINNLRAGENVLALQGLNLSKTSSDFIINASIVSSDQPVDGFISPNAISYTGPVTLEQSGHIIARTFHNGEWSASSKRFFIVPSDYHDLKITEIHYNPLGEGGLDGGSFEFIEIKNTGSSRLDIGGIQFVDGIQYEFSPETELGPGEFIVLASDNNSFYSRYRFMAFDEYSGRLNNDGEWLVMISENNDTICNFRFNDGSDWPQAADGTGYSLVPVNFNPGNDQKSPSDWRASHLIAGSPGRDDDPDLSDPIIKNDTPEVLMVCHNYPNPFSDVLFIDYRIFKEAFVNLSVYNMMGQRITTLVNEKKAPGMYQVEWNIIEKVNYNLAGGMYFYRLEVQGKNQRKVLTKKVMMLRR